MTDPSLLDTLGLDEETKQASHLVQCFGSGSGLDPESIRSLDPYPDSEFRIRIQEGKIDPQKYKNIKKFYVLKGKMFFLRAEGFLCSLDVLYGGLEIGKFQFLSKKIFSSAVNFVETFVIKTLDPERYSA